ncbi:RDD family protein [Aureicoccus marinus]|jgi:uncharacterized RDD family membrane protein YckC|uniref:Transporter n=1 Tax=Aureicoccus marinus TaxID=754435 RepID=A0A2S7T7B9_9FLAO|nr:RDD family protein [Aureicoccus marinus]PQJ15468.1 transporter [Aureicoccus marinus]
MDQFQVETAQNVQIDHRVADLGQRMLAYIVDSIVIALYTIGVIYLLVSLEIDWGDMWALYLLGTLPAFMYYVLMETLTNGRTIGKSLVNIRVVRLDGTKPSFSGYFIRWLLRIIDVVLTSGGGAVLTILLRGHGQRIGDIAAGTTVINERKRLSIEEAFKSNLPEGYTPRFPQVTVLTDQDMDTIRDLFYSARRKGDHKVIISLADKIKELTGIQTDLTPMELVQVVINDFTYYTQQ